MTRYRTLLRAAFWCAAAGVAALAIMPVRDQEIGMGWDKANHMLAFFILAAISRAGWPVWSKRWLLLALTGFGIGIEIVQGLTGRDADIDDVAADIAATIIGLALGAAVLRLLRRRRGAAERQA